MKTSNFDAILASAPFDKTAGAVTSRGTHWTPETKCDDNFVRSDVPLATQPFTGPIVANLTGQVFGRFRVIGAAAQQSANRAKGCTWVVRCSCGSFEHRRTPGLKKQAAAGRAMCSHCDHLEEMKKGNWPAPAAFFSGSSA